MAPRKTARPARAPAARSADKPLRFADARSWAAWLESHHASSTGVWLELAKKSSGVPSVTYAEALHHALVWGWIDGQRRSAGDSWYRQRFTPRGARSKWSKINRDKALALIASGEMKPPGLAEVDRARRDGRWDMAYDSPSRAVVPDDLAAALARAPRARAFFETLESRNRFAVLHRIQTAVKPETRARRIADFVAMLARREKIYP